ncbi:glycerol-3-phosphate 1-O-acyltransferase PlsB [Pseudaeromonas pectinilytica]
MSFSFSLAQALCRLPVRLLVNHSSLPEDPLSQLGLDLGRPIVYALSTDSLSDLLTLELCAKELGLPNPFAPLVLQGQSHPRYVCLDRTPSLFGSQRSGIPHLDTFREWLSLHEQNAQLDIQLVPVTLLWHRAPGRERPHRLQPPHQTPGALRKAAMVLLYGRENRVRFSTPVSLRSLVTELGTDEVVAHKLARVARIHFSRQRQAAKGPRLPDRQALFRELLRSDNIVRAIAEQAQSEGSSEEQMRARALGYLDEMASDFSYRLIRFGDYFLGWLWNKLYRGITVRGAEKVRRLAREGHEIIYMPCHRSHMDYLLLSYVIYHQGMVPPHIAAGINLNFWPAGPVFRHGGAFFLRRSFKGDKLYSTVFREYLSQLFARGYAVEYFTEGGRSRTGRLLQPKTGMIAMTLQAQLRGIKRPLTFVPVYLGYEHVMEVNTYLKELKGSCKEKESLWQVVGILGKLRNFGRSFVNFGEPLTLHQFLQQQVPEWREDIDPTSQCRPEWLPATVDILAKQLMTRINDAAAVNGLTLSALALLATDKQALPREDLLAQIRLYTELLQRVPYSPFDTVPTASAEELLEQALELNKFQVEEDKLGQIISMDRYQAILMTFYRNTILHLFALPSLVATLIERNEGLNHVDLLARCRRIYPLLKNELFLRYELEELDTQVPAILAAFQDLALIEEHSDGYWVRPEEQMRLLLLGQSIQETLQRYAITLSQIQQQPAITLQQLESDSQMMAVRLATLHGIHAPEFSDKSLFKTLLLSLQQEQYLQCQGEDQPVTRDGEALAELAAILLPLLPDRVRRTLLMPAR